MQGTINIEDTITVVRNFLHIGDINEASVNLELIMDLREITERQELVVDILNVRILMELGQNTEAIALVEAASYGLTEDRFKAEYIELKTLKAILYFLSSKFDEVDILLIETLKKYEKFNENDRKLCDESISEISNLKGLIYSNNGRWDDAQSEFQKALTYRKRANHRKEIGMVLFNLANAFRYQDKVQQCLTLLEESVSTFKDIDYTDGLEASYTALKDIHTQNGEPDSAFLFKQKLDELSEKIAFKNYVRETTIQRNTQARELEKLNAEIIQNKQEIWGLKLEVNSSQDASSSGESFSSQIVDNTKQELTEKRNEVTLLSKEVEMLKARISTVEKENEQLVNSSSSKNNTDETNQELADSLQQIESLNEQVNHKTKEIETLNNLVEKQNSDSDEMKNVVDEYKSKIGELEGKHESANVEIKNLKKELKEKQDLPVPSVDQSELEEARKTIEDLKKELKDKEVQADENLKQIEITFEELENAKLKIKELSSQPDQSEIVKETESKVLEEKEVRIANLESELADIHSVNKSLEKSLKEKDAKHLVDMQNLRTEMKVKTKSESSEDNDKELNELRDQVLELKNQMKVKETLLENSSTQNDELGLKIESLEQDVDKLKSEKKEFEAKKSIEVPVQAPKETVIASAPVSEESRVQDLLDSSKLAETIASILNNQSQLKLRFLAMQIGTSPARIMEEVKQLRDVGFVDLQYDSAGDSNPLIVKK